MREEEDCLYWPVKYSSNGAGAGGGSVAGDGEESAGERTSEFGRHEGAREERGRAGRKEMEEGRNIFIVWELVVKIPNMMDKIPSQLWRRFYDISARKKQV